MVINPLLRRVLLHDFMNQLINFVVLSDTRYGLSHPGRSASEFHGVWLLVGSDNAIMCGEYNCKLANLLHKPIVILS